MQRWFTDLRFWVAALFLLAGLGILGSACISAAQHRPWFLTVLLAMAGAIWCTSYGAIYQVILAANWRRNPRKNVWFSVKQAVAIALDPLNWFFPVRKDPLTNSLEKRLEWQQQFQSDFYSKITDEAVPTFLFEAIGKNIDVTHDAIKTLETKAGQQIGFAGTIIAIFAALGDHAHFLWIAVPLAISILLNLRAVFVKEYELPSPIVFNLNTIIVVPENKARIASALTEAYADYSLDLGVAAGRTARYVRWGTFGLVIGVAILLGVTTLGIPGSQTVTVTCDKPPCVIVHK